MDEKRYKADTAEGYIGDLLTLQDTVHTAIAGAGFLQGATQDYRSQMLRRIDAVIPSVLASMGATSNGGGYSFVSGALGEPVKLDFGVTNGEEKVCHLALLQEPELTD